MKIGFFSDFYLPRADGIAFSIEIFRTELEAMGHEVYVFAPRPSWRYREPSKRIIRFPAVKGLFFDDYLTSFFFPPQVMRRIEKLGLDIVHYHTPSQIGLMGAYFALRRNIPLVTTYHTDLYEYVRHYPSVLPGTIALSMMAPAITGGGMSEFRSGLSSIKPEKSIDKWNQKIVERGITMIHNHCDVVVTPALKIEQQLRDWHTQSRLITLPTGVDEITTNSREIKATRRRHHLKEGDQIILSVGRVGTEKNIGLLIESFALVAAKLPRAKLLIVGTGDDVARFKEQAAATAYNDRIIFVGYVDRPKLGSYYGLAHVFAFPSTADTQGLVLNEAAWAGVPAVMIDQNVSLIVREGESGFYTKNTAKDFAMRLTELLEQPELRARLGTKAHQIAQRYSASKQATKLLRLYEETIERHREAAGPTAK